MKDFYYILGVDVSCTPLEIKEAYRKLSKKFHPDVNFNDKYFENHFREIKDAYDTLSNPSRRIEYDKKLQQFKLDPSYQQYAEELKRKEDELKRREEKIRFRQAFPHYHNSSRFRGGDPKSKIRKVDIGFTFVFILITLIFGNYVLNVVNDAKARNARHIPLYRTAFVAPVRHRKKHKLRPANTDVLDAATTEKPQVQPVTNTDEKPTPEQSQPTVSANTEEKQPVAANSNFLYATKIISNVTGVTNMRRYDRYNSPIIKEIPTDSKVLVMEKGDVFYKVSCGGETGYIPRWALETK